MRRNTKRARQQRGAALILTVIVILVLTTLGIAMVTFTTTEERTASSFRDAAQARLTAEAGVRLVQQMFYKPDDDELVPVYSSAATADDVADPKTYHYWGATDTAINTQLGEIGIWRAARTGATPPYYEGSNDQFFRPPFGSSWPDTFAGTYAAGSDIYDLKFNCRNPGTGNVITNWATTCWLETNFNAMLLEDTDWNLETGKITDISFYAPPSVGDAAYGICTVRVTAEKRTSWPDGTLLARETLVAIIGDETPKPAVFGAGDVDILGQNSDEGCGDGCMNIHANGDINYSGTITGGEEPMVTATGDAPGTDGDGADPLTAPEVNPWDIAWKPTDTAELAKYYLVAARQLHADWTDAVATTPADKSGRVCGINGYTRCQDYYLEYTAAGVEKAARSATGTAYLYRWNVANEEWDLCDSAANGDNILGPGTCGASTPIFEVSRAADTTVSGDLGITPNTDTRADLPFNIDRVPETQFEMTSAPAGEILLVDGKFRKDGNNDGQISIVAAGTISNHSNSDWWPASSNSVLFVSGRDIDIQSNCCVNEDPCDLASTSEVQEWSAIWAAHEQIFSQSDTLTTGIIVGENAVNYDDTVNSATQAINLPKATHSYLCGYPDWPWTLPTTPVILSISTASD